MRVKNWRGYKILNPPVNTFGGTVSPVPPWFMPLLKSHEIGRWRDIFTLRGYWLFIQVAPIDRSIMACRASRNTEIRQAPSRTRMTFCFYIQVVLLECILLHEEEIQE
jgi:hypothetical protein